MRSLPEDLAVQYRQRMKTETDAADSVVQPRDEQVKAILKFLQVEVESREETRASREKTTSGRPSTNRKAADTVVPPHLPSALALTARSSSPGADSRRGQTVCPSVASRDTSRVIAGLRYQQRKSANVFPARVAASGAGSKGTLLAIAEPQPGLSATDDRDAISLLCARYGAKGGTDSPQLTGTEPREAVTQREKRVTTAPASSARSSSVLLQTATVWASGTRGRVAVRLLLDTGSQRTFIRKDLSQQLHLSCTGTEEFLNDGLSLENLTEQSSKFKVLGLLWDRSSDDIMITTQAVVAFISTQPSTKRTLLQAFATLFYPLGFVAPFHVTA
ncbi:hypothetical protein MTO96_045373 [Rhipicephalus appendiculatus]